MLNKIKFIIKAVIPRFILMKFYKKQYIEYIRSLQNTIDNRKPTILAINHFYDQDLEACQISNKDFNFVIVDGPTLFKSAKFFISLETQNLEKSYQSENKKNIEDWRNESKIIFNLLYEKFSFKYILVSSDTFYWIREFIMISKNQDIVTVILDKEGTISPHHFESESKRIRELSPIISDYVFVWSERQKSYWEKLDVPLGKIFVIGQARSDLFFLKKTNFLENMFEFNTLPLIVFFSYEDDAYIPLDKQCVLSWKTMKAETHDIFHEMSQKYKGRYNFVVKTHPQQLDLEELQKKYGENNLKVIGGSNISNELIQKATLIIAFQTTVITEAMFMNKAIFYTYWDKNIPILEEGLLPFHAASGIEVIKEKQEFYQKLDTFLNSPINFKFTIEDIELKNKFIEKYIFSPDGNTCNRFYTFLKQC